MRIWPYSFLYPKSLTKYLEFGRHSIYVHWMNGFCQIAFQNYYTNLQRHQYRIISLFNSLSSGFPFIYLMISRAKKKSNIFLLLLVFSFTCAPLVKWIWWSSKEFIYCPHISCFQRFGDTAGSWKEENKLGRSGGTANGLSWRNKAEDFVVVVLFLLLLLLVRLVLPADTMDRTHFVNIISSLCNIVER